MKILAFLLLMSVGVTLARAETHVLPPAPAAAPAAEAAPLRRDPLWPVGYSPRKPEVAPVVAAPVAPPKPRALTEEEMAELIAKEQKRIREMIAVNGLIKRGTRFYAFVNRDHLVTEGDILEVDVNGVPYSLTIKSLSENNIQLESVRQDKPKE